MTTKTTFQRAREENRMRAAIVGSGRREANPESALQAEVVALRGRVEKLELLLQGPAMILPDDPLPNRIRQIVANHYKLTVGEMVEHFRTNERVWPRFITCYLCRKLTEMTSTALATLLGFKDHGSVLFGAGRVRERMIADEPFRKEVEALERIIKQVESKQVDTVPIGGRL